VTIKTPAIALATLLLAAVVLLMPARAHAAGPTRDGFFGVNPGDLFKLPQSQWDTHLQAISDDGVQVVRMGAWWSDLEPGAPVNGQHGYSWSDIDKQVGALARHHLQWEPLLCFSATWASTIDGDYNGAPAGTDNFARFGAALAQRYGAGGSFWSEHPELPALPVASYEIWNEENAKVYWHPGTAGSYADLYAATHSAIHGVDDSARVVVGGLAAADNSSVQDPADFVRAMYTHRPDLRGRVDAVALHPYAREPRSVYTKVAQFRHELDDIAGPGVPLELTEIGWTTADTPESRRADYLREVASTLSRTDCGIDRLSAYAWLGPEQAVGDREQWFGIANRDGSNKPSASAYASSVKLMRGLSGSAPTTTVRLCSGSGPSAIAPAHLRLKVSVKRNPRRAGRVLVHARCSSGCRLRAELRIRPTGRTARASRLAAVTSGRVSRNQTLSIKLAKRIRGGARLLRIKVTAIGSNGQTATRWRTLHVRG
jgi:polysaccharide biosynthesis protein PslG